MYSHFTPKPIDAGRNSRAYWARKPNGTVLVFVHGFAGRSVESWLQFPELLVEDPRGAGCDMVFFGYDSRRRQVRASGLELLSFLESFLAAPHLTIHPPRPAFTYKRVIIVAHSLGAVVARQGLLDAHSKGAAWLPSVELVLFAPAHMGAHAIALATSVLGFLAAPIEAVAKWRFPVLRELVEGSPTLNLLRDKTHEALRTGRADYLKAKLVVLADPEDVVVVNQFCDDPVPITLAGGHTKVCKPTPDYPAPVEALMRVL